MYIHVMPAPNPKPVSQLTILLSSVCAYPGACLPTFGTKVPVWAVMVPVLYEISRRILE